MRFIVPLLAVALVGGYVVGQQPEETPPHLPTVATIGVINDLVPPTAGHPLMVGRYLPMGADRLVDSTNGTLYRIDGDAWVAVVKMPAKPDGVSQDTGLNHVLGATR